MAETNSTWLGRSVDSETSKRSLEEAFDRLFKRASGPPPFHVLEIGCGNGGPSLLLHHSLLRRYGNSGARLSLLDLSMDNVLATFRRFRGGACQGLCTFRGDLYHLPFKAAGFDFVVALNVFYLIEKEKLLAEAARVLKPRGSMLVYDVLTRPAGQKRPLITFILDREQMSAG